MITCPGPSTRMCSRLGASVAHATGLGNHMIVPDLAEYEKRAIAFAMGHTYTVLPLSYSPTPSSPPFGLHPKQEWHGHNYNHALQQHWPPLVRRATGPLADLRRWLYLNRYRIPLYDTLRWVRNLEKGLEEAWRRWVVGTEFQLSPEWDASPANCPEKTSSAIWIRDDDPFLSEEPSEH